MPFFIQKGDLVSMNVDCIVNASNVNLSMVEGVGRAIFHKAGDAVLAKACKEIGHCDVGKAVITPAFGIENTKAIIHAVGPIYINGKHDEEKNLVSAYLNSLNLAIENGYKSIAFPLLSSTFNYPLKECYEIGTRTIKEFLKDHNDLDVYMVMYKNFPQMLNEETQVSLTKYIIDNASFIFSEQEEKHSFSNLLNDAVKKSGLSIEEISFKSNLKQEYARKIIDDDVEDIEKEDIICLAIGLGLDKTKTNALLISKGFVFEPTLVNDLIICYYLDKGINDIFIINNTLFQYNLSPLGSTK
jgi:O-acetyl-ADP-ribose deacetylase